MLTGTALAIELTSELQGKWIGETSDSSCNKEGDFFTTIGKTSIDEGDVLSCKVKKVSGKDGQYKISTMCCSDDGCSTALSSSNYQIKDNILTAETAFGKKGDQSIQALLKLTRRSGQRCQALAQPEKIKKPSPRTGLFFRINAYKFQLFKKLSPNKYDVKICIIAILWKLS